ncbi:MAG: TIR domain-containing protein, partial [Cyanobacteria bacterium J06555_12]
MGNDAEFDVFLCHNSEDKDAVIEIADQLEASGLRPWLDEWELRPGMSWQLALEQQIEQIATAAVFVGESGLGPWQKQEIYAFLNEFIRRNCPVIPVILANAPKRPELPIFLKNNTWVDFRRQRPDPMQRLTWGVTGKKPDRKRESVVENTSPSAKSTEEHKGSTKSEAQKSASVKVELISAVGMDYGKLRDLLAAGKWEEADKETLNV